MKTLNKRVEIDDDKVPDKSQDKLCGLPKGSRNRNRNGQKNGRDRFTRTFAIHHKG